MGNGCSNNSVAATPDGGEHTTRYGHSRRATMMNINAKNASEISRMGLELTVTKMQKGEGLSLEELGGICEVVRLGPSYISTKEAKQALTLAALEDAKNSSLILNDEKILNTGYKKGNNKSEVLYYPEFGTCSNTANGFHSRADSVMPVMSFDDDRHSTSEGAHTANAFSSPVSTSLTQKSHHRRRGTLDSRGGANQIYNASIGNASLTQSTTSLSSFEDVVDSNDPNAIKKIQDGNKLVQRTWNEVKTIPNFTLRLLDRLWDLDANLADSLFFRTTRARQAERLGGMLDEAIQLLDKPDAFMPIMMQLGVKHILYGVGDLHMDVFGGLLIAHLEATFKPPLTPWSDALAKEWKRAFGLMKSLMAQGRSTPQGIKDTKRYATQVHRIVLRCWRSVTDREDTGLETSFVEIMYNKGAVAIGETRAALFSNLVARRRMFMDMLTRLFEIGLNDTEAQHLLHELGARHVTYGLSDADYAAFTDPFVETVVECSRPSTMTPQIYQLMKAFWNECSRLMLEGAAQSRCSFALRLAPKNAPFAIVFTDIEGSTALWETQSLAMDQAVDEHHKLVRDLIHDHNGYEVKTIGDSFMIAFRGLADAVTMALRLQVELLRASVDGLQIDGGRCEASGPPEVWNPSAVRVRVGVHWCTDATPKFDVVYKRYDYYGNDVNVAARVQDAACGGQVMCTEATLRALQALAGPMHEETLSAAKLQTIDPQKCTSGSKASLITVLQTSIYKNDVILKGVQDPLTLHSLYPKILKDRLFGKRNKDVFNNE